MQERTSQRRFGALCSLNTAAKALAIWSIMFLGAFLLHSTALAEETSSGPTLWKLEGGSAEIYLFGSFHLLPKDLKWQDDRIMQALASADTLVTEADISDEAEMARLIQAYAYNSPGQTLRSYFSEEEAQKIDASLQPLGLSLDLLSQFKPWFAAMQASMSAMMHMGFDPTTGVEQILIAQATERGLDFAYLETGEEGIVGLADHPDDLQAIILLSTVAELEQLDEILDIVVSAWSAGNLEIVTELLNASMAQTPALIEALLYKRNRNWVPRIEALAQSEGTYFIAVGAAHLAGENNVIDLLEARGYTATRQ